MTSLKSAWLPIVSLLLVAVLRSPAPAGEGAPGRRTDADGDALPPGAVARLGSVRFRHEGVLGSFVISPDGQALAAVPDQFGKSVAVWDMATGKVTRRLTFDHEVHYLAFTPDGQSIAVGSAVDEQGRNGIVRFVDLASGKESRRFIGHKAGRNHANHVDFGEAIFFTPDGRTMITVGGFGSVLRWDVPSGKKLGELNGNGWVAWGLSPDGKLLAARQEGSSANVLRLFEVATGKEVRQLRHSDEVYSAAFSPDGKMLATASTGPDQGKRKAGTITLWQVENGKELGTCTGHNGPVPALAFAPDGKTLASGGIDSLLCLWDVASQKQLHKPLHLPTSVMQLAFSRDGKTILSRGKENRLRLWDVAAWQERRGAEGPGQTITAIACSPDGKMVASVSGNGGVWLWEAATGKLLRTFEYASTLVRFSEDGKSLMAGSGFSHLRVWDIASGNIQQDIPLAGSLARHVAMSVDGKMLASTDGQQIELCRIGPVGQRRFLKVSSEAAPTKGRARPPSLFALCFSNDGKTLYACNSATHVLRWDVATGTNLPSIGNQEGGANGMALAPDGRAMATVTRNGALYLWEIASRQPRLIVKDAQLSAPIAFAPDGRLLALASKKEEVVQLVRVTDGKVVRRFAGHVGNIFSLSFSPDGRTLASGGHDSTVLLWHVAGLAAVDAREASGCKPEKLAALWTGLRGTAAESYGCMMALAASPAQAVPLLAEKLTSTTVDADRLARLLTNLESEDFHEREEATEELKKLGDAAEPALRQALQRKPPPESRRRLEQLLEDLDAAGGVSGERLRTLRVVEVLERIGDKPARDVLRRLADGPAGTRLTEEARESLRRLQR
jgi:WD40 repeat protein